MSRQVPRLRHIHHREPITSQTHFRFLHHLQSALLLSLRERGRLSLMEYRLASEALNHQLRNRTKRLPETEGGP